MKIHQIPFDSTNIYSKLIYDYQKKNNDLASTISSFPSLNSLVSFSNLKLNQFSNKNRSNLSEVLMDQYSNINLSKNVKRNLNLLSKKNSVTITTGHQLSLMTGPLYFIYKIVSVIKLSMMLNNKNKKTHYIPMFWMASEDDDFEEIKSFYFKGKKVSWDQNKEGPVGEISTKTLDFLKIFIETELGFSESAAKIRKIIKDTYLSKKTLSEATFCLVNTLFSDYGLLVLDPKHKKLKQTMIPFFKKELFNHDCKKEVEFQVNLIKNKYSNKYKPQVNPREINLFYIIKGKRYRISKTNTGFELINSKITFTKSSMEKELYKFPERFSPNVLMRPLFQEVVLPNIAYVGGAAEISYWLQLKCFFENQNIVFPILIVRDSALLVSSKISKSISSLDISYYDLFKGKKHLVDKKIKDVSEISLDLQFLKNTLELQFEYLEKIVLKTDPSFNGAVKAQRSKQFKGIDKLEKRLLKAQKRKFQDHFKKTEFIYDSLFPEDIYQERKENFFQYYIQFGNNFIPDLINNFNPLNKKITILEFE